MPKRYSPKAEPRRCSQCGRRFRPMTDKLWAYNFNLHLTLSLRHKGIK